MRKVIGLFAAAIAAACVVVSPARAGALDYFGTFTSDDQVRFVNFNVASASLITLQTFGYAGGTTAYGVNVARGGFDPVISLFDAGGNLIAEQDDGSTHVDAVTGAAFDTVLGLTLGPGSYTAALTESFNFALGPTLADGFLEAGQGNFTSLFGCAPGKFCDATGAARNGNYALEISGAAVVPEPASMALVGLGFAALGAVRRRKTRAGVANA